MVQISAATSAADFAAARQLFREYADSLGFDLDFQDFETELATLPGEYKPPMGALLLARQAGDVLGCVALRRLDDATCEMKRLYVRPDGRSAGVGRALAEAAITAGARAGYRRMWLDTVPSMAAARALYRSLGFREIGPYRFNPIPGTSFLELELEPTAEPPERRR